MAWGIVHNPADEDLEDIDLTLTTGQPISFIVDLYNPKNVNRVVVEETSTRGRSSDQLRARADGSTFEGHGRARADDGGGGEGFAREIPVTVGGGVLRSDARDGHDVGRRRIRRRRDARPRRRRDQLRRSRRAVRVQGRRPRLAQTRRLGDGPAPRRQARSQTRAHLARRQRRVSRPRPHLRQHERRRPRRGPRGNLRREHLRRRSDGPVQRARGSTSSSPSPRISASAASDSRRPRRS